MNHKMVIRTTGMLLTAEACLLLLPLCVSLYYRESCAWDFLITIGVAAVLGGGAMLACRRSSRVIYAREGFVITALSWLLLSAVGALPFYISREIPSYVDAFFETVSGFTTTGASILEDVEAVSRGLLFWRSFTHWVGGMGVLVFLMAMTKNISERSIHIMRAEMPGPIVDKITPRTKDTAKIFYAIYFSLTFTEVALLLCGGMPLFEALIHSFGTAGTGGFGALRDSITSYNPYLQWVIGCFMLVFGVNFNLYYLLLMRRFRSALKSGELWTYLGIAAAATVIVALNIRHLYPGAGDTLRTAFFQVSSIMTTTGFATADFDTWPTLSKTVLLLLMFIGACAGSTGGGIKVSRVVIYAKNIRREIKKLLHPRSVSGMRLEGKPVDESVIRGQNAYLAVYALSFLLVFFLLSFDRFDIETNLSAAAACFNNIGPGFAIVGPTSNYADYSAFSKLVLSAAMLMGRLEIFPILLLFTPSTWLRRGR